MSGERQRTDEKKEASYQFTERHFGSFSRAFRLPDDAKREAITAEMKEGVLSITIPKLPPAEGRRPLEIPIADSAMEVETMNVAEPKKEPLTKE